MRNLLAIFVGCLFLVSVMAMEASTGSTDSTSKPSAETNVPKKKKTKKVKVKKNSCLGAFCMTCAGGKNKEGKEVPGALDLVAESLELAEDIMKAKEDGKFDVKEGMSVADEVADVTGALAAMGRNFNELRNETIEVEVEVKEGEGDDGASGEVKKSAGPVKKSTDGKKKSRSVPTENK